MSHWVAGRFLAAPWRRDARRTTEYKDFVMSRSLAMLFFLGVSEAAWGLPIDQAKALEARLLAPCCYKQTLDFHASPLADQLRAEVRRRFEAGESEASIEADLVGRYGSKLRAVPDAHFTDVLGRWLAIASGACVLVIAAVQLRRRHAASGPQGRRGDAEAPDREQLEEELSALD